tara:strand:- start:3657 stop:3914 length:258 start_codon:yes stop_codon:yes gene_type:complete
MIDLIHIGGYKTGTSWWQSQFIPNNSALLYIDNPESYPEIVNLMHQLVDSRDLDFDVKTIKSKFKNILDSVNIADKKVGTFGWLL